MNHPGLQRLLPPGLRNYVLHFEASIERAVAQFAATLAPEALVLDAGAGESRHAVHFARQRYLAVDLAVGDAGWDYRSLDVIADLTLLPFAAESFDAAVNIVTLEHLRDPAAALREIQQALKPGASLLLAAPHEWEVHQAPHDYFRYTWHGLEHLLLQAGFTAVQIEPVGGYFRLLARRLLNGLQFFPGPVVALAALFLVPPALILPLLDPMDQRRDFTLGYICIARKPG